MKIHWRIDESNITHTRLTLFLNGQNCGQLCIGTDDVVSFLMIQQNGHHREIDEYKETGRIYE